MKRSLIIWSILVGNSASQYFNSIQLSSFLRLQTHSYLTALTAALDPTYPDEILYIGGQVMAGSKLSPLASSEYTDSFVMKLFHNNGTIAWFQAFGAAKDSWCSYLIVSNATGDLVVIFKAIGELNLIAERVSPGFETDLITAYAYSLIRTTGVVRWKKALKFGTGQNLAFDMLEIEEIGIFISGGMVLDSKQMQDAFITRINPVDGNIDWVDSFGTQGYDFADTLVDVNGTIAVLGSVSGNLDGQQFQTTAETMCFVAWYSPATGIRNVSRTRLFGDPLVGCSMMVASYSGDSIFIAATRSLTTMSTSNSNQIDGLLGRLSASDGSVHYLKRISENSYNTWGLAQVVLPTGEWIICGATTGQIDNTNRMYGKRDLFVIGLNTSDGSLLWSYTFGSSNDDACNALTARYIMEGGVGRHLIVSALGGRFVSGFTMFPTQIIALTFNMTALNAALPFPPFVATMTASTPTQSNIGPPDLTQSASIVGVIVGSSIGGALILTSLALASLAWSKRRRENYRNRPIDRDAEEFNEIITMEMMQTSVSTRAVPLGSKTSMLDTQTVVPSFMGISIPGAYLIEQMHSIRARKVLFKNENSEIYVGDAFDDSIRVRCDGKPVVIKRFLRMRNDVVKASFFQELSLMYLFVKNDLFVRLYGYHEQPYLMVMKYYEGGSLERFLLSDNRPADFKFSPEVKFKFLLQISSAVREMHRLDLAHTDLKLLNVFVDISSEPTGEKVYDCFLGDFGLAMILGEEQLLVRAYKVQNIRGLTMAYAAPEVIQRFRHSSIMLGWNAKIIKAGDIFAFGIMIIEILQEKRAWRT